MAITQTENPSISTAPTHTGLVGTVNLPYMSDSICRKPRLIIIEDSTLSVLDAGAL